MYKSWNVFESCDDHKTLEGRECPGVYIQLDFIDDNEADQLVRDVDEVLGWDKSQSGRRKKNYGPKVNFRKKKLQVGEFKGFAKETRFLRYPPCDSFVLVNQTYIANIILEIN